MKPIYTREEWNKVRQLATKWYAQIDWHIPTKVYYFVLIVSIIVSLFDSEYRLVVLTVTAIAGAKIYAREKQIQSFVEGWQQGQEYITGDNSIDDLLKYDENIKKKSSKS